MTMEEVSNGSSWNREEDIAFETALANYTDESEQRWEKIAADVPGKSVEQIKQHYELLVEDISRIESGCVPLPDYDSPERSNGYACDEGVSTKKGGNNHAGESNQGSKAKSDQERRKGIAWTEDEHRLFLLGLDKYGKGDWRSISRNFVVTRTPTQVASHAQKYYIRLNNSTNKERRRSSIHDITRVENADVSTPQGPITGQNNNNNNNNNNGSAAVSGGGNKSAKQAASQPPPGTPMYGTPTIGGPLVSAVGTPVNFPAPPHIAYGVHTVPVPGSVVPGASMNMSQMPYTMPRTPTAHR